VALEHDAELSVGDGEGFSKGAADGVAVAIPDDACELVELCEDEWSPDTQGTHMLLMQEKWFGRGFGDFTDVRGEIRIYRNSPTLR